MRVCKAIFAICVYCAELAVAICDFAFLYVSALHAAHVFFWLHRVPQCFSESLCVMLF